MFCNIKSSKRIADPTIWVFLISLEISIRENSVCTRFKHEAKATKVARRAWKVCKSALVEWPPVRERRLFEIRRLRPGPWPFSAWRGLKSSSEVAQFRGFAHTGPLADAPYRPITENPPFPLANVQWNPRIFDSCPFSFLSISTFPRERPDCFQTTFFVYHTREKNSSTHILRVWNTKQIL